MNAKHQKDLVKLFTNKEEREKWNDYLDKLKSEEETSWLESDENAVVHLHDLSVNGYLPSDDDKLSFSKDENKVSVFYYPDSEILMLGESFNAFEWKKKRVDIYWPLKRDYLNKIGESEHWKKIVGDRGISFEEGEDVNQKIEETIASTELNEEDSEEFIEEIKNEVRRELAYLRTSDENKWQDDLITEKTREKIFFGERERREYKLEDEDIENCHQLLTNIQTILTKKEPNINKEFLAGEEWQNLNNSLTNVSDDLKEIIKNADYELLEKVSLASKYFGYCIIDEIEDLKAAREFYKENKPSRLETFQKTVFENIHGENWESTLTNKWKKVKLAGTLWNWKEKGYFENIKTLGEETKEEIKDWWQGKAKKYNTEEWEWAKNKTKITPGKIEELKKAVGARRKWEVLQEELMNPSITYEKFNQVWREMKNGYPEIIKHKDNQSWVRNREKELLSLELDWLFENAVAEKKTIEELENYRKRIELFESDFLKEPTTFRATIWKEKNSGSVPSSPLVSAFSSLLGAVTGSSKKGKLDEKLNKLTERIKTLKNWEKEANEGLTALKTKATEEVWTATELAAFQNEIDAYPPCREEKIETIYYRDFHPIYRKKLTIKKQLEQIKNLAQQNANEYQTIENEINRILNKDITKDYNKPLPYTVEKPIGGSSPSSGLDLKDIKEDLKKLRKITPFSEDHPAASLGGGTLSLIHQKVFTNNRDRILKRSLWLERNEYLEELGEELTDFEKSCVEAKKTKPELEKLKKDIKHWKEDIFVGLEKETRQIWQKYFYDNRNTYWTGGGIGLVQLQVLAEKNWHKYFDEEKKLEKLKVGFVLKEYESATGQKARVNCLNTDYLVFQSWDDFFGKHSITDKNDWAIWKKDFADPKEAENSYTNALNALDGFPWSSELSEDDKTKISQAKNPKDIVAQQKEVAWDQFFRANGIKGDDEKRAWKETSGLKNVAEAKIAYGKGWRNLSDTSKFTEWEGRGKVKYKSNRVSTTGVDLTKHSLVEMDEYHQLFCNIHLADNLEALWALNIQGYDENQVPAICSHLVTEEKWKEKEMKLFKTAFEGDKPSGITENADFEAWLKAGLNKVKEIEDYVPGETERKIYDLGWKEPTKIINGYTKYQEEITCDKSQVKIERDNVPVWKVDKEQLKIVLGWTEEVKRKISPQDLVNFITNDFVPKISSLEDDLLPDGLKENDLVSFIGDKYRNLKFQEFKNNFRGHGDEAAGATDEEIELYFELVLDASKEPYWHLRFSEEDSARLFNNGWKDINELRGNSDTGITAEIRGKTCFNPTEKATTFDKGGKREKFEEWVWNTEFWNGDYDSLGNDETLEYRKSFLTIFLPASVARKVFNKNWDASQFDWKNGIDVIVSNYNSHGQDDINLDATVIDRKELDKVNEILFEIKEATNSNNLPSDKKIGSYDEKQVPPSKSHDRVKTLRNNRKIQLEQSTANQQARSAAIQAVNDWWNNAGMSGGVETICGNDWKKKFNNLQGADITNEENRLKNLISQAKVKPDIEAIENELNKKPLISASELQNLDYKGKMINLAAATDAQRNSKKKWDNYRNYST